MRIVIGSDHAGYKLKEALKEHITASGYEVVDVGTNNEEPADYPDFARAVGERIASDGADKGILICGSGIGASIAANKIPGVRAAIAHDLYSAAQGVEHDDMNVIVLGARVIDASLAQQLVDHFLAAHFSGEERHRRRLNKVLEIEAHYSHHTR